MPSIFCQSDDCHFAESHSDDSHFAECHSDDCHFAESHSDECHSSRSFVIRKDIIIKQGHDIEENDTHWKDIDRQQSSI
jgi:hypothetical protein